MSAFTPPNLPPTPLPKPNSISTIDSSLNQSSLKSTNNLQNMGRDDPSYPYAALTIAEMEEKFAKKMQDGCDEKKAWKRTTPQSTW